MATIRLIADHETIETCIQLLDKPKLHTLYWAHTDMVGIGAHKALCSNYNVIWAEQSLGLSISEKGIRVIGGPRLVEFLDLQPGDTFPFYEHILETLGVTA